MNVEFSHLLMNSVDVVESILTPLTARQLNACSRVCKFWSSIVSRMKTKRKTKAWTCLTHDEEDDDLSLIFLQTQTFIESLYTEPCVVFMIFSSEIDQSDKSQVSIGDLVKRLLPRSCKLVGIGCGGIVGSESSLNAIHEVENSIAVSFLCLPKYDGVEFITSDDIESNFKREAVKYIDDIKSASTLHPRAVLTFNADMSVSRSVGSTLLQHFPNCLLAGAYVDSVTPNGNDSFPVLHLTAITGERVQVASVVIENVVMDAQGAENRIKKLKNHGLNEDNSFAFMFACLGRGEGHYGESDVESSLFRKHFPRTPLIGLFGNGEIGFNHVTTEQTSRSEETSVPRRHSCIYHSYTTILVLVSVS